MSLVKTIASKSARILREEGVGGFARKGKNYLYHHYYQWKHPMAEQEHVFSDVLFINGCDESVPHPARYRVTHQREQLAANHISSGEVYYANLTLDQVRFYRTFIFFRCPYTDMIGEFVKLAKRLNKKVLFDVDDLVIDTKYTDTIKYLDSMSEDERALYDDGVRRMGKTLSLCDAAVTTTERLAEELGHYVPEVFINRNTASEEMWALSNEALKNKQDDPEHVRIGYFSGSLTHNDDFLLILPAIEKVMSKYGNVQLHVVGELDLPKELQRFADRVVSHPFMDWRKLPGLIAEVDINLAPLEQSIFNEAKSENKWVESALVKVPTVASNVGAFARMIEHGETGLLCDTAKDWEEALSLLVENPKERRRLAQNAHRFCSKHCVTVYTGRPLAQFLKKYTTPNVAFVLPSMKISGGILVAIRHACYLQDAGYDVMLLNVDTSVDWYMEGGYQMPVLSQDLRRLSGRIDKAVATMWTTEAFLEAYCNIEQRFYLVQNFETDFYEPGVALRVFANMSYFPKVPVQFLTISNWCREWLDEEFGQKARYAPNGLETSRFSAHRRAMSGKIRILIEGDCAVEYKNVDESFRIVDRLDPDRFEIWYMSYNAQPKETYRIDRFLHQIPYEKVHEIYQQCDILLKTSYLESFSYPPLEMMATGGYAVVVPNGGNKEYLKDRENCLLYPLGEIDKAVEAIETLCSDEELQKRLYEGGLNTAKSRDWEAIRGQILRLYES